MLFCLEKRRNRIQCLLIADQTEFRRVVLAVASDIHTASGQLSGFGAVCYVAVIAIGVPTDVRINKQIARWSFENPPSDCAAVRARWIRFHVIRTPFSVPAFVLYAATMILGST